MAPGLDVHHYHTSNGSVKKPHSEEGFSTRAIHVGSEPNAETGAVIPAISLSTTYKQDAIGVHKGYEYSRSSNPNRDALERTLASIEGGGGHGLAFASGSSTTATVLQLFGTGAHIISVNDVYGGTFRYMSRVARENQGLETTFLDLENLSEDGHELLDQIRDNTKLIWIESPTNPTLRLISIPSIRAHISKLANPPLILVDNTFLSPFYSSPLLLGADIVMHSLTKYVNGHSDVVMGALILPNTPFHTELAQRLRFLQNAIGAVPSSYDSWLAQRGAKTLGLRMKAHGTNALAVARALQSSALVEEVIYPGLSSHPRHHVAWESLSPHARKWISGLPRDNAADTDFPYSGMISFRIKGGLAAAERFLTGTRLFTLAESLGGVESLAEHPARMTHGSVPPEEREKLGISDGLVRLSVGVEDEEDLVADVLQALEQPKLIDLSGLSPKSLNELRPSDAETRSLKASLAAALAELHQLEANISLTQRKLASFSARRAQLLDQTERYRVAVAPHKRLPPEILIEIFLACLPHTVQLPPSIDDAPLSLTRICSSWRTLALGAQELWSHFQVVLSARPLSNHRALASCRVWLGRCPDRPLSFNISTAPRAPFPLPGLDHSILPVDLILPHTHRIRSLDMQNISGEQMDSLVSLPINSFPLLEHIDVFLRDSWLYRSIHDPPLMAFRGARRLTSVTLRGFDGTFNPAQLNLPWDQLTVLNLDTLPSDAVGCHEMLRVCERLEEVCVRIVRIEERFMGEVTTKRTRLPRLKKLVVRFESTDWHGLFLDPFEVPCLDVLKTRFDWRGGGGPPVVASSVLFTRKSNPYVDLIERSGCPIRVLHIGRNTPDYDIEELLSVSPALQELYLQDYIVVDKSVWEMIGRGQVGVSLERMMVSVKDVDPVLGMLEDRMVEGQAFKEIKLGCPKMSFQQRWRMECLEKMGVRIGLCHYGFFG